VEDDRRDSTIGKRAEPDGIAGRVGRVVGPEGLLRSGNEIQTPDLEEDDMAKQFFLKRGEK
jgi:hypothetical protein